MEKEAQQREAKQWFENLQSRIISGLEGLEALYGDGGAVFERTSWQRDDKNHPDGDVRPGGGGTMAILRGTLFEKAGVNFSAVEGHFSEKFRQEIPGAGEDGRFWASGVSLVVHPRSPWVPIIHMNTRMICTATRWFGGGIDLTPALPDRNQTEAFHRGLRDCCDRFDSDYYPRFQEKCRQYFTLPHRNEERGVGGIFFDDLTTGDRDADFAFTRAVGEVFLDLYRPIVEATAAKPWGEAEEEAQWIKRSRYVEFNLLFDRGTRFGIMTGGNTEAILMSLPPRTGWR